MQIMIGDFKVESDGKQFILWKKETKGEKAKEPGAEYYDLCGYYSDLASCLKEIPRHVSLRSDCITLESLLNLLKEYETLIRRHFIPMVEMPKEAEPKKLMRTK